MLQLKSPSPLAICKITNQINVNCCIFMNFHKFFNLYAAQMSPVFLFSFLFSSFLFIYLRKSFIISDDNSFLLQIFNSFDKKHKLSPEKPHFQQIANGFLSGNSSQRIRVRKLESHFAFCNLQFAIRP